MISKKQLLDEVEKTLEAYDEDAILEANPFLLTRIKAVQEQRIHSKKNKASFRFSFSRILVIVLLIVNVLTVVYYFENNHQQNLEKKLVLQLKSDFQIEQTQNNF